MKRKLFLLFPLGFCFIFFMTSCNKENFITSSDASLFVSSDSIKFDTVFTSIGSITKSFKIINQNKQKLLLSEIKLMGGPQSAYRININGSYATQLNNVEIEANDSMYVFVAITINPTQQNLPFIISDSIKINYNGNDKFVQLQAYGQNAHFLNNEIITGNVTWQNDLPYVILGSLQINESATLTVESGTKIFVHANVPILVDGSLITQGVKNNEVVFTGDRLDGDYSNLPASWPGIIFRTSSKNNELNFTVIKNACQAIVAIDPSVNASPKLSVHQCIINNAYDAGIFSNHSDLLVENSLISNCGTGIKIVNGGRYQFVNCTAAGYSNDFLSHNKPTLNVSNYIFENGNPISSDLSAQFTNCIFWGEGGANTDEIYIDKLGNTFFDVTFDHSLYKVDVDPSIVNFISSIKNQDPIFDSIDVQNNYYDFRINNNPFAPGLDQGINTSYLNDLNNQTRLVGNSTDMGCYEKQ